MNLSLARRAAMDGFGLVLVLVQLDEVFGAVLRAGEDHDGAFTLRKWTATRHILLCGTNIDSCSMFSPGLIEPAETRSGFCRYCLVNFTIESEGRREHLAFQRGFRRIDRSAVRSHIEHTVSFVQNDERYAVNQTPFERRWSLIRPGVPTIRRGRRSSWAYCLPSARRR